MEIMLKSVYFSPFRDHKQVSLNSVLSLGSALGRCSPSPEWVAPMALSLQAEGLGGGRAAVASTLGNKSVI